MSTLEETGETVEQKLERLESIIQQIAEEFEYGDDGKNMLYNIKELIEGVE